MAWNNTPPHAFARVNTLQTDTGTLLQLWREKEDVEYDLFLRDWVGENLCFELKSLPPLARLESFQKGWFYVQDPSTLMAVRLLDPQPGEIILDLCAAPGGKTTFIAQLMRNQGRIVACDSSPERLKLLRENCLRLGATCVEPQPLRAPDARPSRLFDRVLVDAPCSNTGVMRRRVELRWRLRLDEIHQLRALQLELLTQAAAQVKPGGVLVYSTCSLEPEENSEVVTAFLAAQPGFTLEATRELQPFVDNSDGAFAVRWRRS
jgi:16S rRNA (cytosine967-C5)-methyltransferase